MMNSEFFPLSMLPDLTDDQQHHIVFRKGINSFIWHSDQSHKFQHHSSGEAFLTHIRGIQPRRLGEQFFIKLRETLAQIVVENNEEYLDPPYRRLPIELNNYIPHRRLPIELNNYTPLTIIRDLRYLLSTHYGAEIIIFRPADPPISAYL